MEDISFIKLLDQNSLSKIDIDSRLIPSFKRVINKMQAYFNANGYTAQRDYWSFFNQYLLSDSESKLKILANDIPSTIGAIGVYRHTKEDRHMIFIDNDCFQKTDEYLDATLCHEFIHFLVMRGIFKLDNVDPQIKNGGFINEALTEMLTQQMYPSSNSYKPQVRMMQFANLLANKVNNYSQFLQGHIDSRGYGASSWNNFVALVSEYQRKKTNTPFNFEEAIKDESYIRAQRYIIEANISPHLIKSFDEYQKWILILRQRPVPDNEWIENLIKQIGQNLISSLGIKDENVKSFLLTQLKLYRDSFPALEKYDGKDVYEFVINNQIVSIDAERHLYGAPCGWSASWNPKTGIYQLRIENNSISININQIDFKQRRKQLLSIQKQTPIFFEKTLLEDIRNIQSVAKTQGLIRLERYKLPNIHQTGAKEIYIYVAIYSDRIEILDDYIRLDNKTNINQSRYLGITSKTNGAIYAEPIGTITKGYSFSTIKESFIEKRTIDYLYNICLQELSQEQINSFIEEYKKKEEYSDINNPNILKHFIVRDFATQKYNSMSEAEKQELIKRVLKEYPRFIISTENGNVDISRLFGEEYITAFKGERQVLVDTATQAFYNAYYNQIILNQTLQNNTIIQSFTINLDENGNIIIPQEPVTPTDDKTEPEDRKTGGRK